MDIRTNK